MQKIVFLFFLSVSGISALLQQQFFVYFQADDHQPFYAKINNKIYSSSENGYMIIPKLEDKYLRDRHWFCQKSFPEQIFLIYHE